MAIETTTIITQAYGHISNFRMEVLPRHSHFSVAKMCSVCCPLRGFIANQDYDIKKESPDNKSLVQWVK